MSHRAVLVNARAFVGEYGTGAAAYIIMQLCDFLVAMGAVQDWQRVANAVDAITDAVPQ